MTSKPKVDQFTKTRFINCLLTTLSKRLSAASALPPPQINDGISRLIIYFKMSKINVSVLLHKTRKSLRFAFRQAKNVNP